MQLVMLAAGLSSRFYPFNTKHKSLINIFGEPIIAHTLRAVKRAEITDIIIVVREESEFRHIIGNGKKYGVRVRYVVQKDATGMGDAVLLASKYLTGDFFVTHSTRLEFDILKNDIDKKRITNKNTILLVEKSNSLSSYGTIKTDGDRVIRVIEKPKKGNSVAGYKILGLYFLNSEFLDVLKTIKPSQYSFEDALDKHAKRGNVKFAITDKPTVTLKYPWDILKCKNYLLTKIRRKISREASIAKSAIIEGNVVINDGAIISENAVIKGPAYIGRGAFVGTGSLVRGGSILEEGAVVGANAEVKNTFMFAGSKMHSGLIEDSVIGENARIGAGIVTANTRIDRKIITPIVNDIKRNSGLTRLGVIIGASTHLGVKVTTMPGVIIGTNVAVGPSTTVMNNIEQDTTYYTKFAETIKKKKVVQKT